MVQEGYYYIRVIGVHYWQKSPSSSSSVPFSRDFRYS
jgi:hypothetical protein